MTNQNSNWQGAVLTPGSNSSSLPLDVQNRLNAILQQQPIVEVTIRLFGLGKGQSEVRVKPARGGSLAALGSTGAARAQAYQQLLQAVQRELLLALGADGLGSGGTR